MSWRSRRCAGRARTAPGVRGAPGPGGGDVVGAEHLEQPGPQAADQHRRDAERDRQARQEHRPRCPVTPSPKPPTGNARTLRPSSRISMQPDPGRRQAEADQRTDPDRVVAEPVLRIAARRCQRHRDQHRQDRGVDDQPERRREVGADDRGDGPPEEQRLAEVAAQDPAEVGPVLVGQRPVQAPLVAQHLRPRAGWRGCRGWCGPGRRGSDGPAGR